MNYSQSPSEDSLVEPRNARELEILILLSQQHTNQEIADKRVLRLNTIKWYVRQMSGSWAWR